MFDKWFARALLALAVVGVAIVLGAVGECELGGDLMECVLRTLLGSLFVAVAMAGQAVRQCRQGGEDE